jgi:2-methylisocitrate lyase-like PEP mutase family enzyme
MHEDRAGFVMPNAWDAGSAVLLAEAGFAAIGTTSAGIAHSLGHADYLLPEGATPVSRSEMLDRCHEIAAAVDIPVSGDLEDGYGAEPEAVAETIRLAIEAGLAGAGIEDHDGGVFYDEKLAAERIAAAGEVIAASGADFVLTGRTDWRLFHQSAPLSVTIDRANRLRAAGADCIYVSTSNDPETLATLVREIDAPLNTIMGPNDVVADLRAAGVARISLGSGISRAALGFVRSAAQELLEKGTISHAGDAPSLATLNELYGRRRRD